MNSRISNRMNRCDRYTARQIDMQPDPLPDAEQTAEQTSNRADLQTRQIATRADVLQNKMIARQIAELPEMHSDVQDIEQPDKQMCSLQNRQMCI